MSSKTGLWESLGRLHWHDAISIAIGCAAPMLLAWFLGASIWTYAGPPEGREGTWRWALFIPYPDPFTWREAFGVAIMVGLPFGFLALWALARRSARRYTIGI